MDESNLSILDEVNNATEVIEKETSLPTSSSKKRKKSAAAKDEDNSLLALSSAIRHVADSRKQEKPLEQIANNGDEFDVYGKHIANELRSMESAYNRDLVKKKISDILFEMKWNKGVHSQSQANHSTNSYNHNTWQQHQPQLQMSSLQSTPTMTSAGGSNVQYNSFSQNQHVVDNSVGTNSNQQFTPSSWTPNYAGYESHVSGDSFNSFTHMLQ